MMSCCFLHSLLMFLVCLVNILPNIVHCVPLVPCYFIFGDSLADPGNNNDLETQAKANYPPYGIDFGKGATGRFTNGQTYADVLTLLLGFDDFITPYVSAKGARILTGVNYASGAAGILDESGQNQGERFTLSKQLVFHNTIISQIGSLLNSHDEASNLLSKCLYTFGIGSNDFINNYFMPEYYKTSKNYTIDEFATLLVKEYSSHLKLLYTYGARKVALVGLGQIALTPVERARQGPIEELKLLIAVELFNSKLKSLVDNLNKEFTDAKFTYLNTAGIVTTSTAVTLYTLNSCCDAGPSTNFQCIPYGKDVCENRNGYSFFDNIHPTEAVNKILAPRYLEAPLPTDAHPYGIGRLIQLSKVQVF